MQLKSLTPANEFRFACPVFGAEVRLADCVSLRHQVTIGKQPPERRGCQACMSASKCPMVRMFQYVHRNGEDPGMFSAEPRVGQLAGALLDNIAPIVVSEHLLDHYGVPPTEREIILAGNERTSAGAKARTKAKAAPITLEAVPKDERRVPAATRAKAEPDAATTGDMSAAISLAAKRAAAAPESPAKAEAPQKAAETPAAAPTPPVAAPVKPKAAPAQAPTSEVAKSPDKPLSLLELARQRRAAQAAA